MSMILRSSRDLRPAGATEEDIPPISVQTDGSALDLCTLISYQSPIEERITIDL